MEKVCFSCKTSKTLDQFNKKRSTKDGLQPWCRECNRLRSRRYYQEKKEVHLPVVYAWKRKRKSTHKQRIHSMKSSRGCIICGERDSACLDFHHANENKEICVSTALVKMWPWDKIEAEIKKCVVLCSNCHRKLHAGRFSLIKQNIMEDV
jgi:hypothetical protein